MYREIQLKEKNGGSRETERNGTFFKWTEELSFKRGRLQTEKQKKRATEGR